MSRVPRHIAVIMDGNGRWATQRGLPRVAGHEAGADTVRRIVRAAGERGVEALTLYSFSTENWSRPEFEVESLMALLANYLKGEQDELMLNKVRLRAIGQRTRLPLFVQALLAEVERLTASNPGLVLTLALSYGARTEITDAARAIAAQVADGLLAPTDITEDTVSAHLYSPHLPDPDLLIRTSGELRLSNFLLWQLAYSEIVVTDVLWPDFGVSDLDAAIEQFSSRERRFGRTGAQLAEEAQP